MSTQISGQGWARAGLAFGAALSVLGNVAHTVLTDSTVSLALRVPFAVIWPVALFFGIEVLVRVNWRRKFIDHAGRVLLWLPVSVVAAFVSWLHLHRLMVLAGEETLAAIAGPFAIDGLMIGCTVALLAIRAATLLEPPAEKIEEVIHGDQATTGAVLESGGSQAALASEQVSGLVLVHGGSVQPGTDEIAAAAGREPKQLKERAPRAGKPEQEKAVEMLLDGRTPAEAAEVTGVSRATVGRYYTAMRRLRNDLNADLSDIRGLNPALVAVIRDRVNRERPL